MEKRKVDGIIRVEIGSDWWRSVMCWHMKFLCGFH